MKPSRPRKSLPLAKRGEMQDIHSTIFHDFLPKTKRIYVEGKSCILKLASNQIITFRLEKEFTMSQSILLQAASLHCPHHSLQS